MLLKLRIIRNTFVLLLLVCAAALSAQIAWKLIAPIKPEQFNNAYFPSSSFPVKADPMLPARSVISFDLFGKLEKVQTKPSPQALKKPTDNVSLIGLVTKSDGMSYAFLNHNGKTGVINQGDSLASLGNENLVLRNVRSDGVELERLETNETLNLLVPSSDANGISRKVASSSNQASPKNSAFTPPDSRAKENSLLHATNSDFSGTVFNLKPLQTGGNKQVFIITSGNDRQRLQQLNIQPGDIVTHINKEPADKYSLTQALELFKHNEPITLKLKRGVETLEFTLETTS